MKLLALLFSLILFVTPARCKEKSLPPFASALSQPQMVDIVAYSNTNQVKYLGFDWINTYCFGRVLGCAVSDQPATAEYSYGEILFKAGDWFIYATCFGDGPHAEYKWLQPCWQPDARVEISPRENRTTLIVGKPGQNWKRGMGHTYTVVSAFNTKTQDTWGNGTVEAWRMVIAATETASQLKTMSIDDQLSWSTKLMALRSAGLMTADSLDKVLAEMCVPKRTPPETGQH